MVKQRHTKGPWQVHYAHDVTGYPCYFIHGFSGIDKSDDELHAANMRLISAAPELLEALINAVKCSPFIPTSTGISVDLSFETIKQAQAAIKKAEGTL